MTRKKLAIPADIATYQQMQVYASEHGLEMSTLLSRMWRLWQAAQELVPAYPHLQEPLEAFLGEIQEQADALDEGYQGETTTERDRAIASYQHDHVFVAESDSDLVTCPNCQRQIARAGLLHLPEGTRCDYCYTLPRWLSSFDDEIRL